MRVEGVAHGAGLPWLGRTDAGSAVSRDGGPPSPEGLTAGVVAVAGFLLVAHGFRGDDTLRPAQPINGRVIGETQLNGSVRGLAASADGAWVSLGGGSVNRVVHVASGGGAERTPLEIDLANELVATEAGVWVVGRDAQGSRTLFRVDASNGEIVDRISVPGYGAISSIDARGDLVWIAVSQGTNGGPGEVTLIDVAQGRILGTKQFKCWVGDVVAVSDGAWVACASVDTQDGVGGADLIQLTTSLDVETRADVDVMPYDLVESGSSIWGVSYATPGILIGVDEDGSAETLDTQREAALPFGSLNGSVLFIADPTGHSSVVYSINVGTGVVQELANLSVDELVLVAYETTTHTVWVVTQEGDVLEVLIESGS